MSRVPRIRFKGFEEDWEQRKMGEIAEYKKGPFGSALRKDIFVQKGKDTVKIYEQQNAICKDCKLERYFVTKEYANKLTGFEVHGGDIIVSCAGTIGEIYEIPYDAEMGIINQALMRIKVYQKVVDKGIFIILFSKLIDKFSIVHSNGSAIKNIPAFSDLKPTIVFVPSIAEQKKIRKCFESIDHLITLHQRKLEKLKIIKKSMLENLFPQNEEKTPKIRFLGFTKDWEQRKFSEIVLRESNFRLSSPDLPCVEYEDVVSEAGILNNDIRSKKVVKAGIVFYDTHVLYGKLRPYLHNWLCPDFSGVAVGDWWVLKPCYVVREFIYRIIQTKRFDNATNQSSGSKMPRADWNLVSNTEFMIPSDSSEQEKIGLYFKKIDHLITLHQSKLEKLQKIKKSMLESMFV